MRDHRCCAWRHCCERRPQTPQLWLHPRACTPRSRMRRLMVAAREGPSRSYKSSYASSLARVSRSSSYPRCSTCSRVTQTSCWGRARARARSSLGEAGAAGASTMTRATARGKRMTRASKQAQWQQCVDCTRYATRLCRPAWCARSVPSLAQTSMWRAFIRRFWARSSARLRRLPVQRLRRSRRGAACPWRRPCYCSRRSSPS
mmetsp:Transcript_1749/g.6936  ORF Transcript_1749/g.6936 Transcript_1749/m.6936 type:complete len:203 (+) Transcript_1749:2045-2653(+)